MSRNRVLASAVAGASVLLLAACASAPGAGRACTEIGASNGGSVRIDPARVGALPATGPATARVCVASTCDDVRTSWEDIAHGLGSWFVEVPSLSGPGPVALSVVVTDARGVRLVDARGSLTAREVRPNGPDCPPVAWQVQGVVAGGAVVPDVTGPAPSPGTP